MKYGSAVVFALTLASAPAAFAATSMEGSPQKTENKAR
ncbi:Uncharacterised protein [Ralstonia pickettii]|nr:Uncharacterised protein [Ralstonia pickettii]